jgi:type VI secretion system secreted protein Hcp
MGIYMKVTGTSTPITGDATEDGHQKWVTIDSIQFGVGRNITARTGGSAVREFSAPSLSDITLTKPLDAASGGIFRESVTGNTGGTYQIDVTGTGQGSQVLLSYQLTGTMIANYHISSGGDRPMESFSLNFTKIQVTFSPVGGSPAVTYYDLSTAKAG